MNYDVSNFLQVRKREENGKVVIEKSKAYDKCQV
jgi:hypothetical protein